MRLLLAVSTIAFMSACSGEAPADESETGETTSPSVEEADSGSDVPSDTVTFPSGAVAKSPVEGVFSRNGKRGDDLEGYSCVHQVTDASFEMPEGSLHYDAVSFVMEQDPRGCMGNVDTDNAPTTISVQTTEKIRDGLSDAASGFGQTRFKATITADGTAAEAELACTMELSDGYHEMLCQIQNLKVSAIYSDDSNPDDDFAGGPTVFFVR